MLSRRSFLAGAGAGAQAVRISAGQTPVKLGVAVGCIGANKWTPYQFLDYLAKIGCQFGQFPMNALGADPVAPDEAALERVRAYADKLGITMALAAGSICPSSSGFKANQGTAEEQIARGLKISRILGGRAMRAVVGGAPERPQIEMHLENTARVLKGMHSQIQDSGVKIALENHGGDVQAREVKALIEEVGSDILGVCLDSGNPLWMMEDPHFDLELLGPYAVASHIRDTAVWRVPEGVAVRWVNMGEGNVDIDGWVKKFVRMHPDQPVTFENLVSGEARIIRVFDPETFKDFPKMPASDLSRYLALAERGKPVPPVPATPGKSRGSQQCEDLEVCVRYTRKLLAGI
jgi:sugar phosphate isomerase/epimerase